ncbi:MAG: hypothetical protein Q9177_001376 [Variospora cf. flavescens]
MAGVIARNELSFTEFLEMYGKESAHAQLFKQQVGQLKSRLQYDHTIASVCSLDGLNDGAASLLGVLSLLDPDGIPEYVLEVEGSAFNWDAYPQDIMGYQEARTELLKSVAKKLFIHRLIQDAARASMSDERFNDAFGFTLCLLSSAWLYEEFGLGNEQYRWGRCNEIYRHVLRLKKLFGPFYAPHQFSPSTIESPKLLLDLASYNTFIQMLRDQIGDRPRGTDQSLGVALNELGCAHLQNDDCSEGEDYFKKSIDTLGALDGATRISTSMPLINLAFAYWLQDRFPKASSTLQQALEDREGTYAVNDKTSFV